jgi:hypothetical protein
MILNMTYRNPVFLPVTLAVLLSACQTAQNAPTVQPGNEGRSLAYADGYDDGCKSGYFAAGDSNYKLERDVTRYGYDAQYAQGWNDGFGACRAKPVGSGK